MRRFRTHTQVTTLRGRRYCCDVKGRPRGSRNKRSLYLQEMLLNEGEEIVLKMIERADKGDRVALKLCVERLIPPFEGHTGAAD